VLTLSGQQDIATAVDCNNDEYHDPRRLVLGCCRRTPPGIAQPLPEKTPFNDCHGQGKNVELRQPLRFGEVRKKLEFKDKTRKSHTFSREVAYNTRLG